MNKLYESNQNLCFPTQGNQVWRIYQQITWLPSSKEILSFISFIWTHECTHGCIHTYTHMHGYCLCIFTPDIFLCLCPQVRSYNFWNSTGLIALGLYLVLLIFQASLGLNLMCLTQPPYHEIQNKHNCHYSKCPFSALLHPVDPHTPLKPQIQWLCLREDSWESFLLFRIGLTRSTDNTGLLF